MNMTKDVWKQRTEQNIRLYGAVNCKTLENIPYWSFTIGTPLPALRTYTNISNIMGWALHVASMRKRQKVSRRKYMKIGGCLGDGGWRWDNNIKMDLIEHAMMMWR